MARTGRRWVTAGCLVLATVTPLAGCASRPARDRPASVRPSAPRWSPLSSVAEGAKVVVPADRLVVDPRFGYRIRLPDAYQDTSAGAVPGTHRFASASGDLTVTLTGSDNTAHLTAAARLARCQAGLVSAGGRVISFSAGPHAYVCTGVLHGGPRYYEQGFVGTGSMDVVTWIYSPTAPGAEQAISTSGFAPGDVAAAH